MKSAYIFLRFPEATKHLQNGDVLLFRGQWVVSKMIAGVTASPYSHVGLVKRTDDENGGVYLQLIEFYGMSGGRIVDLERTVSVDSGQIDVYRFSDVFTECTYDINDHTVKTELRDFDGDRVVRNMEKLTGLNYSWRTILCIYAWKVPVLRCFLRCLKKGYTSDSIDNYRLSRFVCSTSVDYAFRLSGYSLVQNKNTNYIEPSDVSRSPNLHYLFTLTE